MTEKKPAIGSTDSAMPVRAEDHFDAAALSRYMEKHVEGYRGPFEAGQCMGGMSNPTFVLTDAGGKRYVLRKKPAGDLLPSAHAVDREFRVIRALGRTDVPVAKAYALCEDESILGQAFYIMEFVLGRVVLDPSLPDQSPGERAAIYDAMNDTLAKLHRVDYESVGLGDYGRVGGYIGRQVSRWTKQYRSTETSRIQAMEDLIEWLPKNLPDDSETTIAHGDFRLQNMILHPTEPRVLAVVDWELGTLGNPLSDLAYNCLPYHMPDPNRGDIIGLDYKTYGIPSESDYVAAYCRRTGRPEIENWPFYLVLSLFRLAAIVQGVYYRGIQGNSPSPEAVSKGDLPKVWSEMAWGMVKKAG
jgi:aminoglycoside phosphotransferase (APT) family kinase protein